MNLKYADRPVAVVDENICKANIERMSRKAAKANVNFRPHFKTHQSAEIGNWFRDHQTDGITVSSPAMAAYFMYAGWRNITIAFPFYGSQTNQIIELLEDPVELRLFLNSPEYIPLLDSKLPRPVKIYVEIDAGYNRTGISFHAIETIEKLVSKIRKSKKCEFHGFYIHDGRTYKSENAGEIKKTIRPALESLGTLKNVFGSVEFSIGDTPSCSILDTFSPATEISPGNFVFYDLMQVKIGSCNLNDAAYFLVCPVAETNTSPSRIIIHGGAVHLSKDHLVAGKAPSFGLAFGCDSAGKIKLLSNGHHIRALSQEHGIIPVSNQQDFEMLKSRDKVIVYPVHSCLSANLFKNYFSENGKIISKRILS